MAIAARTKLTVQESAEHLNVSSKTIRRWITQGLIRAERVGPKLIRVDLESLETMGRSLQYAGDDQ
jgi:excisionase family DNA binding protein